MNCHRAAGLFLAVFVPLSGPIHAGDWPQWRGPRRDGYAAADEKAPDRLPAEFKPRWQTAVGSGFSSPVAVGNTVILLAEREGQETVHAFSADTGQLLWHTAIAPAFEDNWGRGPRSTPLVDQERVYAQACNGEFRCLDLRTGKVLWQTSFEKDFGVKFLGYQSTEGTATRRGNNGSGVIDGQNLILPVGGGNGNSLVCFAKQNGRVRWRCGSDEAAYSSLMIAELAGARQVVAFTADALMGVEVETGRPLWRVPLKTAAKRHAATPVIWGNTVTVNSHTLGLVSFQIQRASAGKFLAEQLWVNKQLRINLATPVRVGNHLYSLGAARDLICADAATGRVTWAQPGFGRGEKDYAAIIVVGQRLLVLTEAGLLVLVEANPERYVELGRLQVSGSHWCHPALARGRLYFRDAQTLYCLELSP
jgi:outer membrane protein assembly factor BamB